MKKDPLLPKKSFAKAGIKTPLSGYRGGKNRLARRIIELMPDHQCYCEPFCGAAWVLFQKSPSPIEVLNDINHDIINFFEVIKSNWQGFDRRCELLLKSRHIFQSYKELPQREMPALDRAFGFWYLLKQCFGGDLHRTKRQGKARYSAAYGYRRKSERGSGSWKNFQGFGRCERLDAPSLAEIRSWHRRLAHVNLEQGDWREVISRYDASSTFFFMDPPYYGSERDYGAGLFRKGDFAELAAACENLSGKFLLTINDHEDIRAIFRSFNIEGRSNFYSVNPNSQKAHGELFITNY